MEERKEGMKKRWQKRKWKTRKRTNERMNSDIHRHSSHFLDVEPHSGAIATRKRK